MSAPMQRELYLAGKAVLALAAVQAVGFAAWLSPAWLPVYLGGFLAVLVALAADWLALPSARGWKGTLALDRTPVLGVVRDVRVTLSPADSDRGADVRVRLQPGTRLESPAEGAALDPTVEGYAGDLPVRGVALGFETFDRLTAIFTSKWGLWVRRAGVPLEPVSFRVVPEATAVSPQAFRSTLANQRVLLQGTRATLRSRSADQFCSVRPYQFPDPPRHIDPRKTAKFGELMTRVYDTYFQHHLVVGLDLGRPMLGHLGPSRKSDYYLSACLALAQNAVRSQDRVSLFAFSQKIHHVIRGARRLDAFQALFEGRRELDPVEAASNYEILPQAVERIAGGRSLFLLLTDATKPSVASSLLQVLPQIARRHLTVVVTLVDVSYVLEEQIASVGSAPHDREALVRLLYGYEMAESSELFRSQLTRQGSAFLTVTQQQWMTVVVKLYALLRESSRL